MGTKPALLFVFAACLIVGCGAAPEVKPQVKEAEEGPPNRLAKESSPYLLQHAHNPVDWYPWGPEAFEKARKEKKLIFLSIGYSSCHWCHVMERESFANKDVAEILNKNFVCIKVDREERPDVDDIYMTALQVMGGQGGWPLSMFLMPDGKPIIGGTYWPREDRMVDGEMMLGFKSVLKKIIELHKEKYEGLQGQADSFAEATQDALETATRGRALVELETELVKAATTELKERIDPVHGGIGNKERGFKGTKFPMPSAVGLLQHSAQAAKDKELANGVALTLEKMALGGIYDHVGGGFHRYSTERTWTVPHFEKMLYDNAQLVELYARAYASDPRPLYKKVIAETLAFVRREMTSPQGAFYSALDADSDGEEGRFYVWTPEEIEHVLGKEDAALVGAAYGVSGNPNFEEKSFILKLARPLAEVAKEQKLTEADLEAKLTAARAKLLAEREKRKRPFLDTKVLTGWNGQMIAAYALAGQVLKEASYIQAAEKAAEFVLANLRNKDGRLLHTYAITGEGKGQAKLNGYLDDYAYLIHGLLNLHEATGSKRWLDEATALTDAMVKWYGDGQKGGYFFTASDHEKLFARPKDYHDGAQPSGNSVAARDLVRLWQKTGEEKYRALAEKSFRQFAAVLKNNGSNVPAMIVALATFLDAKGLAAPTEPKNAEGPVTGLRKSDSVVKLAAVAEKPAADGKQTIKVTLTVEKPWHIYANPVGSKTLDGAETTVTVTLNGKELPAKAEFPKGRSVKDETVGEYFVYEGEVSVTLEVTRPKDAAGDLEVKARVQACTDKTCLLGSTLKAAVK